MKMDFNKLRKKKKIISIGKVKIGGDFDIALQSMTNTNTNDVLATIKQIHELEEAECDIVRVSIFDMEAANNIVKIKKNIKIPLVADIHYDYRIAIESIKKGADKIRINPGNIGSPDRVKKIVDTAKEYKVPIRIGVNTGSLPQELYDIYQGPCVDAVIHAVKDQVKMLLDFDFDNFVIAAKSTNAMETVEIYRRLNDMFDNPLHVGITESGTLLKGTIKSSLALGILLNEGISDTIRISLTDNPVKEVEVAKDILNYMEIKKYGVNIISCPTCGRTKIDLIEVVRIVEEKTKTLKKNLDIAVMGCSVNGINEAKYADLGIAFGNKKAVIFKKGEIIKTLDESLAIEAFLEELDKC